MNLILWPEAWETGEKKKKKKRREERRDCKNIERARTEEKRSA